MTYLSIDPAAIDWARAQFALTAIYHWLFVPLTLGLGLIMSIMETKYYRTGDASSTWSIGAPAVPEGSPSSLDRFSAPSSPMIMA